MKKSLLVLSVVASAAMANTYTLGQINVQSKMTADDINMIEQSVTSATIAQNNERTIAESLDNISGISMDYAGARGENKISVRGHSATRVGVFIDGIPVYVPYDGNFDLSRFLTNDIAQIDVSKGFSSISYGANTMGGVVNIVTKKPTKELEGNIRGELILDSSGKMARHLESINVGSRIGNFYGQLSGTYTKRDHFRLSDDYTPVAGSKQPKGDRLHSDNKDHKISFKVGYIADDASEIALSYANQKGEKEYPISVDKKLAGETFRHSPFWNKETISISGLKNFGNSYIKALAYYDKSDNSMASATDKTYTKFGKPGNQFSSHYDDYSYGTRLEYGLETDANFLKIAANYKKDTHKDYNLLGAFDGVSKPILGYEVLDQRYEGHTFSLGIEDNYKINKEFEILAGISYDRLKDDKAYDSNPKATPGLSKMSAWNPQAALIYTVTPESKLKASISQKTYFPSMKDRFSGRLGSNLPNPNLDKETANHYELGYTYQTKSIMAGGALYFSKVKDAIDTIVTSTPVDTTDLSKGYLKQNQNIGKFDHKGLELDLAYTIDGTKVGGNYAYVNIKNKKDNSIKRTDVPKHQGLVFAKQKVGVGFSLYGNMKLRSGAYQQIVDKSYVETSFTTFDAKVIYEPMKELMVEVGVKNLTDKFYSYSLGYPEAGREYFATMNYKF